METHARKVLPWVALAAMAAAPVIASAQCSAMQPAPGAAPQKQSWDGGRAFPRDGLLKVAEWAPDHDEWRDRDRGERPEAIVGFWRTVFVSKGTKGIPDGTVIDRAFAQWHDDGTEITNSSRPPTTSNFCLGTWKKVGRSTYRLNHFGISWDNSGNFLGLGNIREEVVVSKDRKSFVGTFTIDQYDASGNNLLQHIQGDLAGQRIHIGTKVQDLI